MSDRILPNVDTTPRDEYSSLRAAMKAFDKARKELRYQEALSTEQPNEHNAARLIAKAKMLVKAREGVVTAKAALDEQIKKLAVRSDKPKRLTLVTSVQEAA